MTVPNDLELKHDLKFAQNDRFFLGLSSVFFSCDAVGSMQLSSSLSLRKKAANIMLRTKSAHAMSAGALWSTYLYKNAPTDGPAIQAAVELDCNLVVPASKQTKSKFCKANEGV